jgi:hypothetical protein
MAGRQNTSFGAATEADIDGGTLARTTTPSPGDGAAASDRSAFESVIQSLEAQIANAGAHAAIEGESRRIYQRQIREFAEELRQQASAGKISWAEAAARARDVREAVMSTRRGAGTAVGRAFAEHLKRAGPTLNALIARKVQELYGASANFHRLTGPQQDAVYAAIVKAAGTSNVRVTAVMRTVGRAGRGLILVSIGVSIYEVATAEDKLSAAGREAAVTGVSILGGIGGGAVAGLACGPGAPVCVTVGAFVGGALAAFGVDWLW